MLKPTALWLRPQVSETRSQLVGRFLEQYQLTPEEAAALQVRDAWLHPQCRCRRERAAALRCSTPQELIELAPGHGECQPCTIVV
jgi:hypothetical protein